MRYYSTAYPVYTSTNTVALEIYLSGCNADPHCNGCHSPHTWDFDKGQDINDDDVMRRIVDDIQEKYDKGNIDSICILGGEPLDNDLGDLIVFMQILNHKFPRLKFWMYTHYDELLIRNKFRDILHYFDYIKVGAFDIDEIDDNLEPDSLTGVRLATPNQYFIKGERNDKK